MMTDYIEDTVRDRFILGHPGWEREIQGEEHIGRDFDRWLQKVKAEAWAEGFHATRLGDYDHFLRDYPEADENPYL